MAQAESRSAYVFAHWGIVVHLLFQGLERNKHIRCLFVFSRPISADTSLDSCDTCRIVELLSDDLLHFAIYLR